MIAKNVTNGKVRIVNCINQSSNLVKRHVRKLMAEVVSGILLGKHAQITWECEDLLLNQMVSKITGTMILGIDPGDLNRNGSSKSENICKVRDGGKGIIVNGYPMITVVARCLKRGSTLPVLTRLLSSTRGAYKSENNDIMQTMNRVEQYFKDKTKPLWVIDRGGDRSKLWNYWFAEGMRICVRAANLRYWNSTTNC